MPGARTEALRLEKISKSYGAVRAVREVDLCVQRGEFFSLLGPSGCGKTTLLRIVGGLETPEAGTIHIGGADATLTPPHLRPVNTVFQSYALFPHLNVQDNVSFGLRMKKRPKQESQERVAKVMAMMHIESLATRKPDQISGGQKQRVALARALVNEPDILLLDEPFAAIDFKLRKQLQAELRDLQRRLSTTFLYVTHDQEEALVMSDRLAIMKDGRIEQVGTPEQVYESPRTEFVAQFVGGCNVFEGTIVDRTPSETIVRTSFGHLRIKSDDSHRAGDSVILAIRPEKIQFTVSGSNLHNSLSSGVIRSVSFTGPVVQYEISIAEKIMTVAAQNSGPNAKAVVGQAVSLHLAPESIMVLAKD